MSLFLTQFQSERANLCISLCMPETSRSHHAQQSELAVPAQHCPAIPGSSPRNSTCSSSFYSSSQLAQHFCTIYIFTLARPKVSVAAQNECRAIGLGSSFRRGIASPVEGNGFLPEGFPRREGSPSQPFPTACTAGQSWGSSLVPWLLSLKGAGFAQQPLSTFLRFFSSVLCKSGLEVIAESTGSLKSPFSASCHLRVFL